MRDVDNFIMESGPQQMMETRTTYEKKSSEFSADENIIE